MSSDLTLRHLRILLLLGERPLHGYAIGSELEESSGGTIVLRPGSLYRALHQLLERGYLEELEDPTADPRRRSYGLTKAGRVALAEHLAELRGLVAQGRHLGLLGETS